MGKIKAINPGNADTSLWPRPVVIPEPTERYFAIETAITLRMRGASLKVACKETGLSPSNLSRLTTRALEYNPETGDIHGFNVALPYYRFQHVPGEESRATRRSKKKAEVGGSDKGEGDRNSDVDADETTELDAYEESKPVRGGWKLTRIFERFPEVQVLVEDSYLRRGRYKLEPKVAISVIATRVRDALRALGIPTREVPGYEAIRRYCHRLIVTNTKEVLRARHGNQAARNYDKERSGLNIFEGMPMLSVRQLDFHTWDGITTILVKDPNGCIQKLVVKRFSVGIMIDENPGAIQGFVFVFEHVPSADSFLETVASALKPYDAELEVDVKMSLSPNEPCVISGLITGPEKWKDLRNNAFAVLKTDNAFAMMCKDSISNTMDVTGCMFQLGPVYAWWIRSKIERFNRHFEARTGHRLPSSMGRGPGDPLRDKPVKHALGFDIRVEDMVQALGAFIREHNSGYTGKPTHGQTLEHIIRTQLDDRGSGVFARPLPRTHHDDWTVLAHVEIATIYCSPKTGTAPFLNLAYCRYTLVGHENRFDLNKKKVFVAMYRPNANIALGIVKETNEFLGYLKPEAFWRRSPVPFRMRSRLGRYVKERREDERADGAMDKYLEDLGHTVASGEATSRTALDIVALKQQQEQAGRIKELYPAGGDPEPVKIQDSKSVPVRKTVLLSDDVSDLPLAPTQERDKGQSYW
ncbi:hypothetical protein H3V53_03360 [Paraburkholderia bengalensis]|uniref:Integrase catalytic domain-containing protein n=1 Tax=Paraburkholderia bengalensis TaxID=2747562 RepID=A0ABU8ILA6_9BURK